MDTHSEPPTTPICFGLDRATDELSLARLLHLVAGEAMLSTLVPRMTDQEITNTLDFFTTLFRNHLTKQEYHELVADSQS